jgi:hypothetical protein
MSRFLSLLFGLLLATPAPAQLRVQIPAAKPSKLDYVVPVVAPAARAAAVSDTAGWLAIAHRARHQDAHVTLLRLGADGHPSGAPLAVKLPRPTTLAKYPNYPLGLAFHPKLPLLYVWQDISLPKDAKGVPLPVAVADRTGWEQFDHLLIYGLEKKQPELLAGLCRGEAFSYGLPDGSLGLDATGRRLYVSNVRVPKAASGQTVVGCYDLDAKGMPATALESTDQKALPPHHVAPPNQDAFPTHPTGCGFGFVPVGRDAVLFGGYYSTALVLWRPEDRARRLFSFTLHQSHRRFVAAGHPSLPIVYVSNLITPEAYCFEHVEGNLTLVPQHADFAADILVSGPVVLARKGKVAFGSRHRVLLVNLDKDGRFLPSGAEMAVNNPQVEALAYSVRHDRLYVAVEAL